MHMLFPCTVPSVPALLHPCTLRKSPAPRRSCINLPVNATSRKETCFSPVHYRLPLHCFTRAHCENPLLHIAPASTLSGMLQPAKTCSSPAHYRLPLHCFAPCTLRKSPAPHRSCNNLPVNITSSKETCFSPAHYRLPLHCFTPANCEKPLLHVALASTFP